MALEIERRFLVHPKKLPKLRKGKLQVQGYLNQNLEEGCPEIRIRIEDKVSFFTIKYPESALVRHEFEFQIPLKEAQQLLKFTNKRVSKVRHSLIFKGKTWVVDFFQEKNFPLIIAEVELKRMDERIPLPLWISKEVTNQKRYTSLTLAFKPFQSWKKKDLKNPN